MDVSTESTHASPPRPASSPLSGLNLRHVGVLAALPGELGPFLSEPLGGQGKLGEGSPQRVPGSVFGVQVHSPMIHGAGLRVSCAVSGVGKVAAAHGAAALLASGAEALFVVGTCGGLRPTHAVGELVHLFEAVQWDLSVRERREVTAHRDLTLAWQRQAQGLAGYALTADHPAISWTSRRRRARAVRSSSFGIGVPVADMETAAVGAVADHAGIPWAALRVISDAQRSLGARLLGRRRGDSSFKANYHAQAGRPAATLWNWLSG